ncbi:hypothetical protein RN001_005211 [Aquatica leii]|uniref:Uncharacterized protein n=1 Tax=Aquatica leii TaxID=1421715 RepID=A0AAN7PBM6_9COLE|nr:hypothetical protein RN001_005211 [Aquatica leii]
MQEHLGNNFQIQCWFKPNSNFEKVTESIIPLTNGFTKNDFVIIMMVGGNNALKGNKINKNSIENVMKCSNFTNLFLVSIPIWQGRPVLNQLIYNLNLNFYHLSNEYSNVFIDVNDIISPKDYVRHGLHLNVNGKEKICKYVSGVILQQLQLYDEKYYEQCKHINYNNLKTIVPSLATSNGKQSNDTYYKCNGLNDLSVCVEYANNNWCSFKCHLNSQNTTVKMLMDFYYLPGSAPCRAVLLAAKAVGVELNLKVLDLMKGEHLTPEFLKINPQHTIPTLVDNGFALWESRAIMTYLVSKYGKNDSLYPKDPQTRAVIDQRLYFDLGTLYGRLSDYYYPVLFGGASYDPEKLTKLEDAVKFLDTFLEGHDFAVGNSLTVADLSLVATVSTLDVMDFDLTPYSNVLRWFEKVKATAPFYDEANGKNVKIFKQMADSLLKK